MSVESLSAALVRLREALGAVRLPLELPDAQAALTRAREQAAQLDDYVLPRLGRLDAPLLAVVGGSTGCLRATQTFSSSMARCSCPFSAKANATRTPWAFSASASPDARSSASRPATWCLKAEPSTVSPSNNPDKIMNEECGMMN